MYSIETSFAGCLLPCETDNREPIPIDFIFASFNTVIFSNLLIFFSFKASLLKNVGLHIFGGVLPKSLANLIPLAIALPFNTYLLNILLGMIASETKPNCLIFDTFFSFLYVYL